MIDRNIIGQRITALRKVHNLTQSELADLLGVTHQAVSQWERSETLLDILILPKLAEIFGETTDHFLGLTEDAAEKEEMDTAQTDTEAGETLPSGEPQEPENHGEPEKPVEPIDPADLPERTVRIGNIDEDTSYTVVLLDANGNRTEVPVPLAKRLQIVLEGSCADLTSALSVHVEGDVNGNVCGNVETNTLTVNGDVSGDVETNTLTVNGEVSGDLSCDDGMVTVNGDVGGDVQAKFIAVTGDIGGDVKGHRRRLLRQAHHRHRRGNHSVGGDPLGGDRTGCGQAAAVFRKIRPRKRSLQSGNRTKKRLYSGKDPACSRFSMWLTIPA